MSGSVFLALCGQEDFDRTVLSAVDLSDYPDHPDDLAGMETVRFWNAGEGERNQDYFERLESGDLVLFYRDGTYIGGGRVGIKFEDAEEWAVTNFWNDTPSSLVYTIEDFTPVSVPKAAVNRIFGYSEDYNPHGLIRVAASKVEQRPEVIMLALQKYTDKHS